MNKKLKFCIVTLIEDDIVNFKLISSLSELGIDAGCYESCSTSVIRFLLGLENEFGADEWYDHYYNLVKKGKNIDVSENRKEVNRLAKEIFDSIYLKK